MFGVFTQEGGIASNKFIVKKDEVDKQDVQYLSFRAMQSVFALHCIAASICILSGLSSQSTPLHEHFLKYLPGLKH